MSPPATRSRIRSYKLIPNAFTFRRLARRTFVSFLSVIGFVGGRASQAQIPLSQMYHRSWTAGNGVPSDITGLAQGADGFLWFTSEDGLFRFDGVTFSRYQPRNGGAFLSNRMSDIIATKDGSIWVAYMLGGLTRIKGDVLTNFTEGDGLRGSTFPALAEDQDGRVWMVGTKGIEFIRGSHLIRFHDNSGTAGLPDQSVVVDHGGNVWTNPRGRLMVLERGASNFIPASNIAFYACNVAKDEGVWCRNNAEPLTRFTVSRGKITAHPLIQPTSEYYDMLGAEDGTVWIATYGKGIERVAANFDPRSQFATPEFFSRKDGLTGDRVLIFLQDQEGSVWVVTDRGVDQFRPVPFHVIPIDIPMLTLPSNNVGAPFLIGTDQLAEVTDQGFHYLSPNPRKLRTGVPGSIYRADDGSIWYWVGEGLFRYARGRSEKFPLPTNETRFPAVQVIVEDANHAIWVSIRDGALYRLDGGQWVEKGGYPALPNEIPYVALRDHHGDLWFGYRNNKLARVSSDKVTLFDESSGLNVGDVRTLTARDGYLWIGGDRGVVVFDQGRMRPFLLRDTPGPRGVSGLVFASNGDLWINSSSGVLQILQDGLSEWSRKQDYRPKWRLFDSLDGLQGISSTFSGNPSAAAGPDGKLYFATKQSLQWIDPLHIPNNPRPPQVWITSVRAGDVERLPTTSPIRLAPDKRNLEIDYTATSLLIPERVRFRYRLRGFENDWIDAETRRQAFYAKLPPGTYTFEVNACNDSGLWSTTGAHFTLVVPPTFLETIWFKLAVLLATAALLFLYFRIRLNRTKRRIANHMYEILGERQRIARDLHDTLLQSVQALMFKIAVATRKLPVEDPVRGILETTLSQSDQVLLEGRKLISNLQTKEASSDALLESLRTVGEELQATYPSTQLVADAQGTGRVLSTVVSPELFTIGREALTNAFRHADANHVWLILCAAPEELRLELRDDGHGIEEPVLTQGYRSGHWGLRNMKERAQRLGGRFTLTSSPTTGTTIEVAIPAFVAYKDAPRGLRERVRKLLG